MNQDLRRLLNSDLSKTTKQKIINYVGDSQQKVDELLKMIPHCAPREQTIISWALSDIAISDPALIKKHNNLLIELIIKEGQSDPIKRNLIRIYQFADIPGSKMGILFDHCMAYLNDINESIAVRVFSMTVCYRIVQHYPELGHELKLTIEEHLEHGSSGFINRANKILGHLSH